MYASVNAMNIGEQGIYVRVTVTIGASCIVFLHGGLG